MADPTAPNSNRFKNRLGETRAYFSRLFQQLQKFADSWWYAPIIGLLALLDFILLVVPTDALLISTVLLAPRRWLYSAFCLTLGSCVGIWIFALLIQQQGMPFLLHMMPGIESSQAWLLTQTLMQKWGSLAVFFICLSPIIQHPVVALAALSQVPSAHILFYALVGRTIKYTFLAALCRYTPSYFSKT